jgi:hypothetical protein
MNIFIFFFKKTNFKLIKELLLKDTFALPYSSRRDTLISIKQSRRILLKIWNSSPYKEKILGKIIVYKDIRLDNDRSHYKIKKYDKDIKNIIFRSELLENLKTIKKIIFSLIYIFITIILIPFILFSRKYRQNLSLLPEFTIQIIELLLLTNKFKVQKLYYLDIHVPESNLLSTLLINQGVRVIKVPDSNPLFMFNKNIVSSETILTLGYQVEEFIFFNKNKNYKIYPLTEISNFKFDKLNHSHNKKICYYSHGSFTRLNLDHNRPKFGDINMELTMLNKIKNSNFFTNVEIVICLHPKEKTDDAIKDKAINFYKNIFGDQATIFNGNSYDSFNKYDLGFGAFSSILFERIYCHHKTIIFNDIIKEFPIKDSDFNVFIAKNIDELLFKIQDFLKIKNSRFFNNLKKYTYKNSEIINIKEF